MSEKAMPILDHLEEVRWRILISIAAILVVATIALFFSNTLLKVLLIPSGGLRLKAFSLMDGFTVRFQIALYTGVAAAFPIWDYEVYRFLAPGLLEGERRALVPGLLASSLLFALGVVFGYVLLREMIRVMISFFPPQVDFLPAADDYISFVIFFLAAAGIAFQLPVVITMLVAIRILSAKILKKQRRIAYFALFVFAEIVTPVSDPIVAPLVVMIPLVILYEVSIWVAVRIEKKRLKDTPIAGELMG